MKKMMIFAALAAVTLSPAALAFEPVQLRIGLDGIDLTTQRGMKAAQQRIDRATADFCYNGLAHLSDEARMAVRKCRAAARANALAQLGDRRVQQLAAR
jgi:UrcA family protein